MKDALQIIVRVCGTSEEEVGWRKAFLLLIRPLVGTLERLMCCLGGICRASSTMSRNTQTILLGSIVFLEALLNREDVQIFNGMTEICCT